MLPLRYIVPVILILAFQYVFVKDGLNYASPFVFQVLMFAIMVAVFSIVTGFKYVFNRRTVLFSIAFWLSGVCWMEGLRYVSSSESAILSFTMPLFSIPLAVILLRERTTSAELLGAVIGFSGVALYNIPLLTGNVSVFGIALTLADGFFWALFSVYGRKLSAQDPMQTMATAAVVGLVLNSFLSVFDFSIKPSVNLLVDVSYQGLLPACLSMYLWLKLLKLEKTSRVTTLTLIAPVITLAFVVVTTGILPDYLSLGGISLIFMGVYIANIVGRESTEGAPIAATPVMRREQDAS